MSREDPNDVIIVRKRHGDGEEDHHGGVWKLAFADFMTAMMAFFLVMWLINSTTKETKASIVQYFNPVQLVDSKPAKKGLQDPKDSGQGSSMQRTVEDKSSNQRQSGQDTAEADAASLHKDPIKALDAIAKLDPPPGAGAGSPGNTLPDPFDRMDQRAMPDEAAASAPKSSLQKKSDAQERQNQPAPTNPTKADANANANATVGSAIETVIKAEAQGTHAVPKLEVKGVEDGVLISLTDDANFSMFDVGSIKPKPQLVRILQKIGGVLTKRPGNIEIGGHTDGRAYKSGSYDNWRLSADRANMVLYMLVRGGLPAARVTRISGYADRRLKTPEAPLAPANRRIEILLRGDRN
ncbi:flagellar motor protein MotB [Methylocystis iwaonis]|uniref:Flagellar motor protein MotB n=1 Tax=Methylocystis iwaonis TaxID=2885079 RepID=A0ABN6VB85_9HYPH|nr:flagellar motor protein MotB [Methylocystis iwaonis]BDV32994.1 flagellar motor protein MotB [Methylocystis iwaonis]